MLRSIHRQKLAEEGYIYASYGHPKYLKHAIASVVTLRRYDEKRPVALVCVEKHKRILEDNNLTHLFDIIHVLSAERASIVGFKHNIHEFLFFEKNIFLDSDIVWCKNPDKLWQSFLPYDFTITGTQVSDNFFGGSKDIGIIKDILFQRRRRTLNHFGLNHLSRVQTGIIYAQDYSLTKKVCEISQLMLDQKHETHFKSRVLEPGRSEESCEWSMAMAMSKLNLSVYPWLQGQTSPQLDYISDYTEHDPDFEYVKCKFYCNKFIYSFRGLKWKGIRNVLVGLFSLFPGNSDYLYTTPFCLHFGWYHEKEPFYKFAERNWNILKEKKYQKLSKADKRLAKSFK